jgi:hypothetical protein
MVEERNMYTEARVDAFNVEMCTVLYNLKPLNVETELFEDDENAYRKLDALKKRSFLNWQQSFKLRTNFPENFP